MGQYSILPSDDFIIIAGGAGVVNRVGEKMQKKSRRCPLRDRAKPNYSASAMPVTGSAMTRYAHGRQRALCQHRLPWLDVGARPPCPRRPSACRGASWHPCRKGRAVRPRPDIPAGKNIGSCGRCPALKLLPSAETTHK